MRKKILIMYITVRSGHYHAAQSIEKGIRLLVPDAEILTVDTFTYLNPVLARIVDRLYLSVVQKRPELWNYLYDNPKVIKRSDWLRQALHRYDSPRLTALVEEFGPDAVVCTQAFPCGLVADYKKENRLNIPLYGVITDFSPHAYWVHDPVDGYVVPVEESREWLVERRVRAENVHVLGIPIDPRFSEHPHVPSIRKRLQLEEEVPTILLMGGGQGLGPMLEAVKALDGIPRPMQLLVVTGSNEKLYHKLIALIPTLRHRVQVFGHVEFISDLMSVASMIITKPGGLTTSEALAKGLPLVILNPLPGQEIKNADFLTRSRAACLTQDVISMPRVVQHLIEHPEELKVMASQAMKIGKPNAALDTARLVLNYQGEKGG
ncbi:MAG: hypothetical protein NC910_02415 [Candidatus Omnitrophica bacterium]|nr:hypothetical protein [Candidatus Omnitrophota bacterium]